MTELELAKQAIGEQEVTIRGLREQIDLLEGRIVAIREVLA